MRLFTAIDVDDDARERVSAEQRRLKTLFGGDSHLRWTTRELVHVTLVFIGNVDEARAPTIVASCKEPIAGVGAFRMTLGGLGVFPPRGEPRVLWLGVSQGAERVASVHEIVADRLRRLHVPIENRPFHAHVTLGRWREARPRDRRTAESAAAGTVAQIEVRDVALYQSRLSSSGPAYTMLARADLI